MFVLEIQKVEKTLILPQSDESYSSLQGFKLGEWQRGKVSGGGTETYQEVGVCVCVCTN